jgi:hypothetical protein
MDKARRVEMLKARFRATGGFPFVPTGIRKPRVVHVVGRRCPDEWPQIEVNHNRTPDWMRETAHQPKFNIKSKRQTGESALIRMSRKLCLKLPKVLP